jgi:hypothetical protein
MSHWGFWRRWLYGATEAYDIAEEIDARMPEFAEILAEKVALKLKGGER